MFYYYSKQKVSNTISELSSYDVELKNRVTQNDIALWVTSSNFFYINYFLESY